MATLTLLPISCYPSVTVTARGSGFPINCAGFVMGTDGSRKDIKTDSLGKFMFTFYAPKQDSTYTATCKTVSAKAKLGIKQTEVSPLRGGTGIAVNDSHGTLK